jgi:hypothetical protein
MHTNPGHWPCFGLGEESSLACAAASNGGKKPAAMVGLRRSGGLCTGLVRSFFFFDDMGEWKGERRRRRWN